MPEETEHTREERRDRALDRPREFPLAPSGAYPLAEEEPHLRDYLQVVLRRKWIVITFLITVLTTVAIATFMMKPQYKSSVTIKIDKENPNILAFKDVVAVERPEADYYETQYKILKSRNLAKRVIRQMKLDSSPEFAGQKSEVKLAGFLKKSGDLRDEGIDSSLVDSFIGRIQVVPQHARHVEDDLVQHSPSVEGMRMGDHHDAARRPIRARRAPLRFENADGSGQEHRLLAAQRLGIEVEAMQAELLRRG